MNKYVKLLLFYSAVLVVYFLNVLFPNAPDGGLDLGGLSVLGFGLAIIIMLGISIYKGIRSDKGYFIIAAIHFIILSAGIFFLFL